ncbi:MAG: hypothetical protein AB7H96_07765 [Vicinamibacterales bacterium]
MPLSTALLQVLTAFAVSLALVPISRYTALRYGFVAKPRADRWHHRPTALLGGVAIVLTALGLHLAFIGVAAAPVLLVGTAAMFVLGLVDDIVSLKPVTKLVFEIAVASVFAFFDYRLGWFDSQTLDTLVTIFWIVGFTNAFNLLDNMDGLCAGLGVIAGAVVLAGFAIGGFEGPEVTHLALLLGATAGFLVYNVNPASIFMGDSGSLFIGLNLAVLTLGRDMPTRASADLLSIMAAPMFILLVPILDTALVTLSRWATGRSAAQGGRDHSSHRLVAIGLSERSAVFVLWVLAALGGALGITLSHSPGEFASLASAGFILGVMIFAVYLAHVRVYDEDDTVLTRAGGITPIVVDFVYRRRIGEVLLDVCLTALAYYSAYRLRFGAPAEFRIYFPQFLRSLPLVVGVQVVSLYASDGYRGVWRYFGMMDSLAFVRGVGLGTLVNISVLVYAYRFEAYSRGVFIIHAALLMLFLTGSRASFRLISEFVQRRTQRGMRVVIYGAGDVAASAVHDILRRREGSFRMLGFIVEDPSMERTRMQGYPVLGSYGALLELIEQQRVDLVVLTQLIDVDRLTQLHEVCAERRVSLERLHFHLDQLVAAS